MAAEATYHVTYKASVYADYFWLGEPHLAPVRQAIDLSDEEAALRDRMRLLWRMPLFAELAENTLDEVAAAMRQRTVESGEVIVAEGEQRSDFFVIVEGEVEVFSGTADGHSVSAILRAGEHFGEYALFADVPYQASYRAATAVGLLVLDEPTFDRLTNSHQTVARYVEQMGSRRRRQRERRLKPRTILEE